jgi:hypothetical protein
MLLPLGCSSSASLAPSGGSCLNSTDCAEGLICVLKPNAAGYCSNDVGLIQYTEEAGAPVDATVRADAGDAMAVATGDAAPEPSDGAVDSSSTVVDAAPVKDASTPVPDSSSPVPDAAPAPDASTVVDATAPVDAAAAADATTD